AAVVLGDSELDVGPVCRVAGQQEPAELAGRTDVEQLPQLTQVGDGRHARPVLDLATLAMPGQAFASRLATGARKPTGGVPRAGALLRQGTLAQGVALQQPADLGPEPGRGVAGQEAQEARLGPRWHVGLHKGEEKGPGLRVVAGQDLIRGTPDVSAG